MLQPPKSPLLFAERPKEIPHKFLSPIQCCAFPISAQSTLAHDCDFLWVSPQFTHLDEPSLRRVRRKCKRKTFPESENHTPHKKYAALKFTSASTSNSSASTATSSCSSSVTNSTCKRSVFQDIRPNIQAENVEPIIRVESVLDTSVCSAVDDTLEAVPLPSYLQSLFDTATPNEQDFGDILVPETPRTDYTLTVRQKQLKNMKYKTKCKLLLSTS